MSFFSFKQKCLDNFAERFLTLAVVLPEQHLPMSTVLALGQFMPCRVHGSVGLCCPARAGEAIWSLDAREGRVRLQGGSLPGVSAISHMLLLPYAPVSLSKTVL